MQFYSAIFRFKLYLLKLIINETNCWTKYTKKPHRTILSNVVLVCAGGYCCCVDVDYCCCVLLVIVIVLMFISVPFPLYVVVYCCCVPLPLYAIYYCCCRAVAVVGYCC